TPGSQAPLPKRIVIFADGTGNAFSTQESNVWRLYQALDKTGIKTGTGDLPQIARYIPGVGTSSRTLIRLLDGITGYGVPANVRHLYRFVCMNWNPGDQIVLFGFSRGAFTVRTLAAMIRFQGLMPRAIAAKRVTEADLDRAVMSAWFAYRAKTAPFYLPGKGIQMNPLIALARQLRDGFIKAKRAVLGQPQHSKMVAAQPGSHAPLQVPIAFMGLFDTVEAYGVPSDALRRHVNWWLWPIVFRNRQCSPIVAEVRHALALDDARLTFHPVRFDMAPRTDGLPTPAVQERWFAGMHSDIGGGYPDDANAMAPLAWIAAEATGHGVTFDAAALQDYARRRFDAASIHDSRLGLGQFYRYAPRMDMASEGTGAPPVVDPAVMTKITTGVDGYAPLNLPADMVIADGGTHNLTHDRAAAARTARLVSWRKATNAATILCLMGLAFIAVTPLWQARLAPPDPAWLTTLKSLAGATVPSWTARIWQGLQAHWQTSLTLTGLIAAIHMVNLRLAAAIRDTARGIWNFAPPALYSAHPATSQTDSHDPPHPADHRNRDRRDTGTGDRRHRPAG
nr:DUF2235 domain-containing protein [Paracoccaceae bacterium]